MNTQDKTFTNLLHPMLLYLNDNEFYRMLREEDGKIVVEDGKEVIVDDPERFKILVSSRQEAKEKGIPLDKAVCRRVIIDHLNKMTSDEFLRELTTLVCTITRIDYDTLYDLRKKRDRVLVEARNMIMVPYFCTYEKNAEYPVTLAMAAGIFLKDHATVLNSIKTVNALLETDKYFRAKYEPVWELIKRNAKTTRLKI